jgi:hypothetical protein
LSEEPDKKKKLWQVDSSLYQKGRRAGFFQRRVVAPLRQFGKFVLIGLGLTYPIYLVYIGLAFGGIAFWAFLVGSFALIGIIISRLGYAGNFRNWDMGGTRIVGFVLAFVLAAGFYAGLIYLKTWIIPITVLLGGLGLFFVRRRKSLN